jgi:hypothetical protein
MCVRCKIAIFNDKTVRDRDLWERVPVQIPNGSLFYGLLDCDVIKPEHYRD